MLVPAPVGVPVPAAGLDVVTDGWIAACAVDDRGGQVGDSGSEVEHGAGSLDEDQPLLHEDSLVVMGPAGSLLDESQSSGQGKPPATASEDPGRDRLESPGELR